MAGDLAWPATPDLGAVVRRRIAARPAWYASRWALAAVALVVIVAGLLAYPPTRSAIAGWVNLHTSINRTTTVPTPSPLPPGPLGRRLGLGSQSTLTAARAGVSWNVLLPGALGRPDEVYLQTAPDGPSQGEVTLVYGNVAGIPVAGETGVSVLVTEARGAVDENFFGKTVGPGTTIEPVTVNGHQGWWISGQPHAFFFTDANGRPEAETLRLATNTLIIDEGGTIVRIEGDLTEAAGAGPRGLARLSERRGRCMRQGAMRSLLIVLVAVVVVGACGRVPQTGPGPGGYRLYEARAPAVPSSTSSTRAHTRRSACCPSARRPPTGTTTTRCAVASSRTSIRGQARPCALTCPLYALPPVALNGMPGGLSQNGRWLVRRALRQTPAKSHLLVVDTSFAQPAAAVDLDGSFVFDAISNDGERLYLLQYLSANDYAVRVYNVSAGLLDPYVVVDKFDPTEPMTGQASTVASADGQWQFTVYARASKGAFIHALMLGGPISLCLELPGSGGNTDPSVLRWSLALSPDGTRVYATNGALGLVVEVAASGQNAPAILRTTNSPRRGRRHRCPGRATLVSPDGRVLAVSGGAGVEWVDVEQDAR